MLTAAILLAAVSLFISVVGLAIGVSSARQADRLESAVEMRALREAEKARNSSYDSTLHDCLHVWGKWSPVTSTGAQIRYCSLCGRAASASVVQERREVIWH